MATWDPSSKKDAKEPQKDPLRGLKAMLAGGGAGAFSKTMVAPFERVKILCQNGKSKGFIPTIRLISEKEGLIGFWRGNNANVIRVIPNRALMYSSNEYFKEKLKSNPNTQHLSSNIRSIATGAASGAVAVISTYPLDVVRGRMGALLGPHKYTSITKTLIITWKEEGIRGYFRGMGPTTFAAFPYEGIKFGTYDFFMRKAEKRGEPGAKVATHWALLAGGVAGAVAGTLTYPIDTVRRRMQMQGTEPGLPTYRNSIDCFFTMWRTEGVGSLLAGVVANFWRVAPAAAIQFAAYEGLKNVLGLHASHG